VDRDGALLKLMQFFISASGCKGKITSEMQIDLEHVEIIRSAYSLYPHLQDLALIVMDSVAHPGSRIRLFPIQDLTFFHPGSRIRIKEFKYFNPESGF
jgi:hypothetical protein